MARGDRGGNGAVPSKAGGPPKIGGLDLGERLAEGRWGVLHRAREGRRTVAVKVFHPNAPVDRNRLESFVASDSSSLRHPNLIPLHSVGETDDGRVFCAMPLLGGDPLDELLTDLDGGQARRPSLSALAVGPDGERHPEAQREAAHFIAEAAAGLGVAHRAGIAHGRVHPRNLIFSPGGRLVVTDFDGLPDSSDDPYLAPEGRRGDPPSAAGDVYSLGKILEHLLGGADEESRESKNGGAPTIPAPLRACVRKATAGDPENRYANASEFAVDLERYLAHDSPLAHIEERERNGNGETESLGAAFEETLGRERAARERASVELEAEQRRRRALECELERVAGERRQRERPGVAERDRKAEADQRIRELEARLELEARRRTRAEGELSRRHEEIDALLSESASRADREANTPDTAREADRPAVPQRRLALPLAASLAALAIVVLAGWAMGERGRRQRGEESARAALADLETGNAERILRRAGSGRDDPISTTLGQLARTRLVRDELVGAVLAVVDAKPETAVERLRTGARHDASELSSQLDSLAERVDADSRRDPVVDGLASEDRTRRLVALTELAADVRAGRRAPSSALLAIEVADPADAELFGNALETAALAGESLPLVEKLGLDGRPVHISFAAFHCLFDALARVDDRAAREIIRAWGPRGVLALASARNQKTSVVEVGGGLTVDVSAESDAELAARRWIDWLADRDLGALVDAGAIFAEHPRYVPVLLDAIAGVGVRIDALDAASVTRAVNFVERIAFGSPGGIGELAIETLASIDARKALRRVAAEPSATLDVRAAALERIAERFPKECVDDFTGFVLRSPHRKLRDIAFRALRQLSTKEALAVLPAAVRDPELRDDALRWLSEVEPTRCGEQAIELLRHPKGHVRRIAFSVLSRIDDPAMLIPLTARLFDPDPGVRAAALTLLKEKAPLLEKRGTPEAIVHTAHAVLARIGNPFLSRRAAEAEEVTVAHRARRAIAEGWHETRDAIVHAATEQSGWLRRLATSIRERESTARSPESRLDAGAGTGGETESEARTSSADVSDSPGER